PEPGPSRRRGNLRGRRRLPFVAAQPTAIERTHLRLGWLVESATPGAGATDSGDGALGKGQIRQEARDRARDPHRERGRHGFADRQGSGRREGHGGRRRNRNPHRTGGEGKAVDPEAARPTGDEADRLVHAEWRRIAGLDEQAAHTSSSTLTINHVDVTL